MIYGKYFIKNKQRNNARGNILADKNESFVFLRLDGIGHNGQGKKSLF